MFVSERAQVASFDAVFFSVFGRRVDADEFEPDDVRSVPSPPDERPRADHRTSPGEAGHPELRAGVSASPSGGRQDERDQREVEVLLAMASDEERLGEKRFDALDSHELAQLYRLMSRLELARRCGGPAAGRGAATVSTST